MVLLMMVCGDCGCGCGCGCGCCNCCGVKWWVYVLLILLVLSWLLLCGLICIPHSSFFSRVMRWFSPPLFIYGNVYIEAFTPLFASVLNEYWYYPPLFCYFPPQYNLHLHLNHTPIHILPYLSFYPISHFTLSLLLPYMKIYPHHSLPHITFYPMTKETWNFSVGYW